ncbi:MAG: dephospho-CoA kinase [Peptostreptococcaceae bacterium]|jgi:dephospho-CoA kinase|nr:dephospho-CoA kinase [Peptostreptococcaceae bacterium]
MLVVGLTGNIGCGKSSLSELLMSKNIDVIDADIISREIMYDKELLETIFYEFGTEIKNNDGTLNRKKLGNIVFNDDDMLMKLNSITHPAIKRKINDRIIDISNQGKNIVVIDAALLIEGKFLDLVDKLVVITCNEEVQLNRVINRDNMTKEEALKRINSQMKQDEKIKYADYIIDNSKDMNNLKDEFDKLFIYIKENWIE